MIRLFVRWCGGVVVWWCGGVVVWWCGGAVVNAAAAGFAFFWLLLLQCTIL